MGGVISKDSIQQKSREVPSQILHQLIIQTMLTLLIYKGHSFRLCSLWFLLLFRDKSKRQCEVRSGQAIPKCAVLGGRGGFIAFLPGQSVIEVYSGQICPQRRMDHLSACHGCIPRCIALSLSHILLFYRRKGGEMMLLRWCMMTALHLGDIGCDMSGSLLLVAEIGGMQRCVGSVAVGTSPCHAPSLFSMQALGDGQLVMISVLSYGMLGRFEVYPYPIYELTKFLTFPATLLSLLLTKIDLPFDHVDNLPHHALLILSIHTFRFHIVRSVQIIAAKIGRQPHQNTPFRTNPHHLLIHPQVPDGLEDLLEAAEDRSQYVQSLRHRNLLNIAESSRNMREGECCLHPSSTEALPSIPLYADGRDQVRFLPAPVKGFKVFFILALLLEGERVLFHPLPSEDFLEESVVAVRNSPAVADGHGGFPPFRSIHYWSSRCVQL